MNITFYSNKDEDPKHFEISDLVDAYFKSDYCRLPMPYERSFIGYLNERSKKRSESFKTISDPQWNEIYKELEKQR